MKNIDATKLLISLLIPNMVGGVGALVTTPKIQSWYSTLNKPFFSPPNWIFGPVWTGLFLMMGLALYVVWQKNKNLTAPVFKWFWIQLGLNCLWSYLFFYFESPALAFGEILILWWSIRMNIKSFAKVGRTPVTLMLPYLAWVSFAAILNAAVWWLN